MEIATGLIVAGVGYLIGTKAMVQSGGNPDDWKTTHPRAREYKDLTVWPDLPLTVKRVHFNECDFTTIPDLNSTRLSNITFFNCNIPVELPRMPETLTHLYIENCETEGFHPLKISNLPSSLKVLVLSSTLIDILPELPSELRKLTVSHAENSVELISLPKYLRTLEVKGPGVISNLSTIEFPERLETLIINNCQLTEISYIPDSVTFLNIIGNQFETLCFPGSLKFLIINDNKFSSIERLPSKLNTFSAVNNQITKINAFPYTLRQVFLVNNKLTKIPAPAWNMWMNVTGNQFPAGYIRKYIQTYKNRRPNITAEPIGLSTREPLSSSEWYNMCNSETNIISQNPWAEEDDSSNVVIITKDSRDNCYDAKDLEALVKNTDLHVQKWKERPGQNNDAASMSMGFGFEPDPNSDVYVKLLPEYGSSYIRLDDVEKMLYNSTKRYFVTSSLGNHRVGNLQGSRGVSEVHGQGPPFPELLTLSESSVTPSMKVREAPVIRPTETTEQSRREFAERIAASRARQAAINMDDDINQSEPEWDSEAEDFVEN